MANTIYIDDPRLTADQRHVAQQKMDALSPQKVELSYKDAALSGMILLTMHWYSGPTRLQQTCFPAGWLGPVSGYEPKRGRRRR